jgi:hypothetical protein
VTPPDDQHSELSDSARARLRRELTGIAGLPKGTAGRGRLVPLAVAAAVVVVAVGTAVVARQTTGDSSSVAPAASGSARPSAGSQPSAGAAPEPTTVGVSPSVAAPPVRSSTPLVAKAQSWLSVRSDANPRLLVIVFGTGDCDGPARATASVDGSHVSVELVVDQQVVGACDAVLRLRFASVELPTDLRGRTVVDAFTGQAHRTFDGTQLLTPNDLPAGFVVQQERSDFNGQQSRLPVVPASAYWSRLWSAPANNANDTGYRHCNTTAPRGIQLRQGPGQLPHWDSSQVKQVGSVRLGSQDVPILRIVATGDLDASWQDPSSHQRFSLESVQECTATAPYTVAEFSRIAQSLG